MIRPDWRDNNRLFTFVGGRAGAWRVTSLKAVTGDALAPVSRVDVVPGRAQAQPDGWALRGVTSNERYVTRDEKDRLAATQPALGRPDATSAALLPIRKSMEWWSLAQSERRAIFEESSGHVAKGLRYLPAIARRLHHCRDLGDPEPFDFLTWFEFAPADAGAFGELLESLRATEEWRYVEREVEVRMERAPPGRAWRSGMEP